MVIAARPGADPETMANSVAAPLERRLGEISGVTEITSTSSIGNTSVVVQFDIDRDINGAARDVQAAINAAITDLPSDLPTRPYYRKFNPADAPIMTLALSSDTLTTAQIYDAADSILAQRLAQAEGVSQVTVNGAEKPAVRVRLDPVRLAAAGLAGQDVLTAIKGTNVLEPTGSFQGPDRAETIGINGQISQASDYAPLVIKTGNGAVLRLSDVATVIDGVANTRLAAWNGKQPAILLTITKSAGANVIETVDRIKELLPQLMEWLPANIKLTVICRPHHDDPRLVADVQYTMLITIALVLLVVLVFMRRLVPTIAAAVTVPLSICGTLAGMWFMGYPLDNFSLMALTISVGFVVDDAIVMIENIVRHRERGVDSDARRADRLAADRLHRDVDQHLAGRGVHPADLHGRHHGPAVPRIRHDADHGDRRLGRGVADADADDLRPATCAATSQRRRTAGSPRGSTARWNAASAPSQRFYARTLGWALEHRVFMLLVTLATIVLTVRLYTVVPKGFLPLQDTGILIGSTLASPDVSFQAMEDRQRAVVDVVLARPRGGQRRLARSACRTAGARSIAAVSPSSLKPLSERGISSEAVIARLRGPLEKVAGVQTTLFSAQDLRGGGRQGGAQYQYAVVTQDVNVLRRWALALEDKLRTTPGIVDVTSDQDRAGPQVNVVIDRDAAARLGINTTAIDNALNNAYSQRQISTIYAAAQPVQGGAGDRSAIADRPVAARSHLCRRGGRQAGAAFGRRAFRARHGAAGGASSGAVPRCDAQLQPGTRHWRSAMPRRRCENATRELRMPEDVRTEFAGNARFMQQSLASQPLLIAAALISIYIVLGVLYESLLHPLTIISTLPSAGARRAAGAADHRQRTFASWG